MLNIIFSCSSRSLSCYIDVFPFTPGLSDPQVSSRHQPGECSDGWHESSGGRGGQRWQHWPGAPQGSGESWTVFDWRLKVRMSNPLLLRFGPLLSLNYTSVCYTCRGQKCFSSVNPAFSSRWTNTRRVWQPWWSLILPPLVCLKSRSEKCVILFTRTVARCTLMVPTWTPRWGKEWQRNETCLSFNITEQTFTFCSWKTRYCLCKLKDIPIG